MFILDVNIPKVQAAMFAHERGVIVDIESSQAHWACVYTKAKSTQMQSIVASLPKFRVDGIQKACEACQIGKQVKHAFPHNAKASNKA